MPLLDFKPTVTVVHPEGWLTWIGFPGPKPFGRDEGNALTLPQGTRLERWATELSGTGPALFRDVALVNSEGGTILLQASTFDNLVQSGVLEVDKHRWDGKRAIPTLFP